MSLKKFFENYSDHNQDINFFQKHVDDSEPEVVELDIVLGYANVKKSRDMYFVNTNALITGIFKKELNGYVLQRIESVKSKTGKSQVQNFLHFKQGDKNVKVSKESHS
jgi:hypothetical protein